MIYCQQFNSKIAAVYLALSTIWQHSQWDPIYYDNSTNFESVVYIWLFRTTI